MYASLLGIHSWLRWLALVLLVVGVVASWVGWRGRKPFTEGSRRLGLFLILALDLQFLVGLVLYVHASPITQVAFQNMGVAMKDATVRFFTVEHIVMGVLALAAAHIGHAKSKRLGDDVARHRARAIWWTVALVLVLAMIPWPGRSMGRPLFRL